MKQRGFTLVEIAIVLIIIGLLLGGILSSQSIISSVRAKDVAATIDDLRTATAYFKQRYHYLPGDWPYTAGEIANVASSPGNGNGSIDGVVNATGQAAAGSEVAEAPLQLFDAGLIGKIDNSDARRRIKTFFGAVQIVSTATAQGLVPGFAATSSARNAIVFVNLPCDIVNEVDAKVDDGDISTGNAMAVGGACVGSNTVQYFAVVL